MCTIDQSCLGETGKNMFVLRKLIRVKLWLLVRQEVIKDSQFWFRAKSGGSCCSFNSIPGGKGSFLPPPDLTPCSQHTSPQYVRSCSSGVTLSLALSLCPCRSWSRPTPAKAEWNRCAGLAW